MPAIKNRQVVFIAASPAMVRSRCRHRQNRPAQGPVRTVVDDSGSLAITAWTCADCGDLIEELRILPSEHLGSSSLVVAAVASKHRVRGAAASSVVKGAL